MASLAKLSANRNNALRSTGPRTRAGIVASSKNALKHGLSATSSIVLDNVEDPAEYEALASAVIEDLDARGTVEILMAERIAMLFWRLRRVVRVETEHLSQWHWDRLPSLKLLDAALKEREERTRISRALGNLFRPSDDELDRETATTILNAFMQCLDDGQREFFRGSDCQPIRALTSDQGSGNDTRFTVGSILAFFRAAESRLEAMGKPFSPGAMGGYPSTATSNLVASLYDYYAGLHRQWDRVDEGAASGLERERTDALLLTLSTANVIDRYEPQLRRDLSRTLKDLQDLQERRRVCLHPADQGARL